MLLLGEPFRVGRDLIDAHKGFPDQLKATASHVQHLCRSFETHGYKVFVDGATHLDRVPAKDRPWTQERLKDIADNYKPWLKKPFSICKKTCESQSDSWRFAWQHAFTDDATDHIADYDYILALRFDVILKSDMGRILANLPPAEREKLLVPYLSGTCPNHQVNDMMHWVPVHLQRRMARNLCNHHHCDCFHGRLLGDNHISAIFPGEWYEPNPSMEANPTYSLAGRHDRKHKT